MNKDKKEKNMKKSEHIVIEKKKMYKILKIILPLILIICILFPLTNYLVVKSQSDKLYNVKSLNHLEKLLFKKEPKYKFSQLFMSVMLWFPYDSYSYNKGHGPVYDTDGNVVISGNSPATSGIPKNHLPVTDIPVRETVDYSQTNIQVENVDEADIIKTDGKYVYSISKKDVVITEVIDKQNPRIMTKIAAPESFYPMDILINKEKILIISVDTSGYSANVKSTNISIYDLSDLSNVKKLKSLDINAKYNTSRMIDDKVYLFADSSIYDRREISSILEYKEDFKDKNITFDKVKYIKNNKSKNITTLISLDLNDTERDAKISSYLLPINIAYISQNNIYILDGEYDYSDSSTGTVLERLKGLLLQGFFAGGDSIRYTINKGNWSNYKTQIAKYKITENGEIEFVNNAKIDGQALNQYSCDEKDGNLRIALNDRNGTKIKVLDENLNEIGDTGAVAKGEDNKSVRFDGNRAYFVTYKKVDPLYAIDLSDPRNPKIMGELKIPGFSTYLHPYDDNHIIGIGQATNEEILKDEFGRPLSEIITFNGMKMSIFDISDMKNPKQKDVVYFGDRHTGSAINKNAKALLFSKEKNLIAIPINNVRYINPWIPEPITIDKPIDIDEIENSIHKEGFIVYNLTSEGFKYKGLITHDFDKNTNDSYNTNKTMRGLYIDDNLITVSEKVLKINDLKTLEFISNINVISGEKVNVELGKTILGKEE